MSPFVEFYFVCEKKMKDNKYKMKMKKKKMMKGTSFLSF